MNNPTMLYRCPGPHRTDGVDYDYIVVDEPEVQEKLAEGWHRHYLQADEARKDTEDKLAKNEKEQVKVSEQLKSKLRAVHKGRGVYELHDESGAVVASGLTRDEAQARVA